MLQKLQLPEDPLERKQFLLDNCLKNETGHYFKRWSKQELIEAKDVLAEKSIQLKDKTAEFDDVKKDYSEQLKTIKTGLSLLTENIRVGGQHLSGELYLFDDQEAGKMMYYNEDGELIKERRLLPQERQTRMNAIRKAI